MKTGTTVVVCLMSLISFGSLAKADDVAVAAAPVAKTDAFALDFSTEVDYFNFAEDVTVVTPTVGFKLFEVLDASVALPIYNDSVETGVGNVLVGANYGLFQDKSGLLWSDSSALSIGAVVGIPLDGQYASDNTTFAPNIALGFDWGKVGFDQTVSYLFESGDVYVATLGGFVDAAVLSTSSTLSYNFTGDFNIGAVLLYTDAVDSGQFATLGPCATYKVTDKVDFDVSLGFPVIQEDMPYGEADFTLSAGIGFAF